MLKCGIVGLPNIGKSSLFNKLTDSSAPAENYPFCTIKSQTSRIIVQDPRLKLLADTECSKRVVPAYIEITDIAGLVEGASLGKGMGNHFLQDIREVDAILHVVRTFQDTNITHVKSELDPQRDLDIILTELICADLHTVERRLLQKKAHGTKQGLAELKTWLEQGNMAYTFMQCDYPQDLHLLTSKPMIILANGGYAPHIRAAQKYAESRMIKFVQCDVKTDDDFYQVISNIYNQLGLISYFTCGPKETRAWSIKKESNALVAAGKIHSDFEKKFVRGQVTSFTDFLKCKSLSLAAKKGLRKTQGKDYIMQDGDIVNWLISL